MPADAHWLRRALSLARAYAGATWPNPSVGACLVDAEGRLLSEGVHRGAGLPHAEVMALSAPERIVQPERCTLYVSLEPCNHHGRTPPCTEAILRAGIGRVVAACRDSNRHVRGGGMQQLHASGVSVAWASAELEAVARELNHPFFESDGGRRAHVTLKLALSADDRLARRYGRVEDPSERAISSAFAQRRVHRLRAQAGSVLVGRGTIESDRPRLSVRAIALAPGRRGPRPVLLDSQLQLTPADAPAGALILHAPSADARRVAAWRLAGCEPSGVAEDEFGLSWSAILAELFRRDLCPVLVEGGASVAASLLASGLADRLHLFRAPFSLPGPAPQLRGLDSRPEFRLLRRRRVGPDSEAIYVRRRGGVEAGAGPDSARA